MISVAIAPPGLALVRRLELFNQGGFMNPLILSKVRTHELGAMTVARVIEFGVEPTDSKKAVATKCASAFVRGITHLHCGPGSVALWPLSLEEKQVGLKMLTNILEGCEFCANVEFSAVEAAKAFVAGVQVLVGDVTWELDSEQIEIGAAMLHTIISGVMDADAVPVLQSALQAASAWRAGMQVLSPSA